MHNMELNNWTDFVIGTTIPAEVNFINLDTRDFQWFLSTFDLDEMDEVQNAYNYFMMQSDDFKRRHSTTMESLSFLVQFLYERTGGEGDWRHLCYKKSGGWLKYIWFIRVNENEFAVYDRDRTFIDPTTLKDILDFDSEYAQADGKSQNDHIIV